MPKSRRKAAQKDLHPQAKGKHGLLNQGATCYLNSVLQVLFMTPDFRKAVERSSATESMDCHLSTLFKALERGTASTVKITDELKIKVNQQRDAAEYLELILSRTSPQASKIFSGQLTPKCKCHQCERESTANQCFWSLPLPLVSSDGQDYKVVDGVQEYFRALNVTGENQIYCEHCKEKTDSTVKLDMTHHPEVLTLLLKRFHFDHGNRIYIKNQRRVEVPFRLTVENQNYELYAFVEHFGSLRGGHYIVNIKFQDDMWYKFDDIKVTQLNFQPFQVDCSERSESAYLLFYKAYTNEYISAQNGDASPPGDLTDNPKMSTKTEEREEQKNSDDKHKSAKKKGNKKRPQLDVDNRSKTLEKVGDDGESVTKVKVENTNKKMVNDWKEAGKNQRSLKGKDGADCTQTYNIAQGNNQQEKDEELGAFGGENGLKVPKTEEFDSKGEKRDQQSEQCSTPNQEQKYYQHNREEQILSKPHVEQVHPSDVKNTSRPSSLSKGPPQKKYKISHWDKRDDRQAQTRTIPEGIRDETVADQGKAQRGMRARSEESQIKEGGNTGENRGESTVQQMLARSKVETKCKKKELTVNTQMDKPVEVFAKTPPLHTSDMHGNGKNQTLEKGLGEPIPNHAIATQPIQIKKESVKTGGSEVVQALLRANKKRETKRVGIEDQMEPSVRHQTVFSIASKTDNVSFKDAPTQQTSNLEGRTHPKSDDLDVLTEGLPKSVTDTPQNAVIEASEEECLDGNIELGSKGLTQEQMKPAQGSKTLHEIQPNFGEAKFSPTDKVNVSRNIEPKLAESKNLEDSRSTGLPEQTVGIQPEQKSSTEQDIKAGPEIEAEKRAVSEKKKKGKNKSKTPMFTFGIPHHR